MLSMSWPQYLRHECSVDGRTVRLWSSTAELLAAMLVAGPDRFLTMCELVEAAWPNPDDEPEYAENVIHRQLFIMRRKGICIENNWGVGWRIPRRAREGVVMREAA